MSLADHVGGDYIQQEGMHRVQIVGVDNCENLKTGNRGIQFDLATEFGKTTKHTVWVTKDNGAERNLRSLANFCTAAGMTAEQLEAYDDDMLIGQQRKSIGRDLKGCWLRVEIKKQPGKDGKEWHNVVDTFVDGEVPTQTMGERVAESAAAPTGAPPTDSEIPF